MDRLLAEVQEFLTGVREAVAPERVLATVMFVDIVGSTERATRLGDREWRDLLNRYYAIVRRQLARFRGREIDTAGDGLFATFDGPARGIRCGSAIADAVGVLDIAVRVGIHSGECEVIGEKVGGIAVHTGARIAGHASPGEVQWRLGRWRRSQVFARRRRSSGSTGAPKSFALGTLVALLLGARSNRGVRRLAAVRRHILAACDRPTPTQSGEQLFLLARVELSVCTQPKMPK